MREERFLLTPMTRQGVIFEEKEEELCQEVLSELTPVLLAVLLVDCCVNSTLVQQL